MEFTDNKYEGNDPYAKAYRFSKFVGLSDKIKLIPVDSQGNPEKNKPVENKPIDNFSKSTTEEIKELLLQYFQKNDLKSIKLAGKNLIVEKNDNSISTTSLTAFPKLKGVERYLENKPDKKVSRQELEAKKNSDNTSDPKPQDNTWKIVCGIGGTLTVIVIIGLFLKRKNKVKKP